MLGVRRSPRFSVTLPVQLRAENAPDVIEATSANVSREGMFVRTEEIEPVGTRVRVRVHLPARAFPVTLDGLVVRANPHDDGAEDPGPHGMALYLLCTSPAWDRWCQELKSRAP